MTDNQQDRYTDDHRETIIPQARSQAEEMKQGFNINLAI